MESYPSDNSFPPLMQSNEIYPQLPSPETGVSDHLEGEAISSPARYSQLLTPPSSSDLQLTNDENHNIELDDTGIDGYDDVLMYMPDGFSADPLIEQFDSIPTCEELCQTLNNWTDSYTEQTMCPSCGQAFVEGTLWCITCDSDQIIVDDTWAENAETVDGPHDVNEQIETLDYNDFLDPSLDDGLSSTDQKKWVEFLDSGMFLKTEGVDEDIDKLGHFVCDSNLYSLGSIYPVETSI